MHHDELPCCELLMHIINLIVVRQYTDLNLAMCAGIISAQTQSSPVLGVYSARDSL